MSDLCLIVGAGPVGLTLASLLTKYQVPFRIIDQNPEPVIQTKAAGLWSKTLEALHHLELDQKFLEVSHRSYAAHIYAEGKERVNMDLAKIPSHYNFITLIPQHVTESVLARNLREHGVNVERGLRLLKLEGNRATLEQVEGGATEVADYRFIFGSDGAHSRVRKEIGASFEGERLEGFWMVGDMIIEGEGLHNDEISIFMGPEGPLALFALGAGRYRVVAQGREALNPVTQEFFDQAARGRIPFPVTISDPQHMTMFLINERQADRYRQGPAFLMGDAAHIHSPAGGQGVNTGMQDTFNLAWKVAQVVHWGAPDSLLDSYHQERHPVARRVLDGSSRALRMVAITNPVARKVRSAAMTLVGSLEVAQAKIREAMSEIDIAYPASPLNVGKGTDVLKPGDRIPEVHWRDGKSQYRRVYDAFTGFHWTLLSKGTGASLPEIDAGRLRQIILTRSVDSTETRWSDPMGMVAHACGLPEGGHLLIRPDGYLAGYFGPGQESAIREYWQQHCGELVAAAPA